MTWRLFWFILWLMTLFAACCYGLIGLNWRYVVAATIVSIVAILIVQCEWYK